MSVIARKYVVQINGQVAAEPFAHYDEAVDVAVTFAPEVVVEIVCYWSSRVLWRRGALLRGFAGIA